mgnify:CR=1 FL=1
MLSAPMNFHGHRLHNDSSLHNDGSLFTGALLRISCICDPSRVIVRQSMSFQLHDHSLTRQWKAINVTFHGVDRAYSGSHLRVDDACVLKLAMVVETHRDDW